MRTLNLDQIIVDQKLNPRTEGLDFVIVSEYAEQMRAGDIFPPVIVVSDGSSFWLVDGFHRIAALRQAGITQTEAVVHTGDWRDAKLLSFSVNSEHGKRRTNADKRQAVIEMLQDEEWRKWSDREIARRCRVSHEFVRKLREEILTVNVDSENERTYVTKHGTISTMQTANIGKTAFLEPPEQVSMEFTEVDETNVTASKKNSVFVPPRTEIQKETSMEITVPSTTSDESPEIEVPPRAEAQKEKDRIHNRIVVTRHIRLAAIIRFIERIPAELITFTYRDLARLYHPDKQHGVEPEIAKRRSEMFALISEIREILEVDDANFRELTRSKGIVETTSQDANG